MQASLYAIDGLQLDLNSADGDDAADPRDHGLGGSISLTLIVSCDLTASLAPSPAVVAIPLLSILFNFLAVMAFVLVL